MSLKGPYWAGLALLAVGCGGGGSGVFPTGGAGGRGTGGSAGSATGGNATAGTSSGGAPSGGQPSGGATTGGTGGVRSACSGAFGSPGIMAADPNDHPNSLSPTGDELELFYIQGETTSNPTRRIVKRSRNNTNDIFGPVTPVTELASACGTDIQGSIDVTDNGLRMYIDCEPQDTTQPTSVRIAQRTNRTSPFTMLNGTFGSVGYSISVSTDELTLYATPPPVSNGVPAQYTRPTPDAPFTGPTSIGISTNVFNPEPSYTGLELYGSDSTQLLVAQRNSPTATFGTPTPVAGITPPTGMRDVTPAITPDCRAIYFVRIQTATTPLWMIERAVR